MLNRKDAADKIRREASELAKTRIEKDPYGPPHQTNGDERKYGEATHYAMSFTKGLDHDKKTGLIKDTQNFRRFRKAIDSGRIGDFKSVDSTLDTKNRKWEAPTAGYVFDLQGPDSLAVTMPPAPALGSVELTYEMAEVYELALLRDVPLSEFTSATTNESVLAACTRLDHLYQDSHDSMARKRITNAAGHIDGQTILRGSTVGVEKGPYLSQFMHIGSELSAGRGIEEDGLIGYGAQIVDQRVPVAHEKKNYLDNWDDWHCAQQGDHLRDNGKLFCKDSPRFITTPRDLATYVHDDALYQAYLNACLLLLGHKAPFDHEFDELSGMGTAEENNAGGFALFGGPHILTLVTEVATRALKAVRYQKFQNHLRLRPEALAARIEKAKDLEKKYKNLDSHFSDMQKTLLKSPDGKTKSVLEEVKALNKGNFLLPMAFQEGSPMHPSFGAGHAAVAGACVTILKAFFETTAVLVGEPDTTKRGFKKIGFRHPSSKDVYVKFTLDGDKLKVEETTEPLHLEGELNKLAGNISIGRNMAGVHYFSDYYDSLRMGEAIAIGVLEEQALCYTTDQFTVSVPKFEAGIELRIPMNTGKPIGFA